MLVLVVSPVTAQQSASPPQPVAVDTQRLDSLRRTLRTPADTLRRVRRDTTRLAVANPVRQRGVRPVTPVRPVSSVDSVRPRSGGTDGVYDVVLDVPNLSVEEIVLQVDNDGAGCVLRQRDVGNVLKLAAVSETRRPDGSVVRVVRDVAGSLLEVTLGAGGQMELVRRLAGTLP